MLFTILIKSFKFEDEDDKEDEINFNFFFAYSLKHIPWNFSRALILLGELETSEYVEGSLLDDYVGLRKRLK